MHSHRPLSLLLLFILLLPATLLAQVPDKSQSMAWYEVRSTIEQMFDGMRTQDTTAVREVFHPFAQMSTTGIRNGSAMIAPFSSPDRFIGSLGGWTGASWDERIWDVEIIIEANLATAIVPYAFFLGDQLSHCGTNMFQLFQHEPGAWVVTFITDTRSNACDDIPYEKLEETNVRVALRHYLNGHATGMGSEHEKVFHPESKLFWMRNGELNQRTSEAYIAGASGQPAEDEAERKRYVEWVDIAGDAAVARVVLDYPRARFVDYMSMLKVDGRWQIINKTFHVSPNNDG